jgi:hypothetical protein
VKRLAVTTVVFAVLAFPKTLDLTNLAVPLNEEAEEALFTAASLISVFFLISIAPLGLTSFPFCGYALIATNNADPRSRCLFMLFLDRFN